MIILPKAISTGQRSLPRHRQADEPRIIMWVFGYGSLLWKVDFPYEVKQPGFIKSFARRFWQGSTDHRGVPGKPGRVVTLVPSEDAEEVVWGMAYKIAAADREAVQRHLDYREKNGYQKVQTTFHPQDARAKPFDLCVYVATRDNPAFLGPADVDDIALQIYQSVGPSGPNSEYLFQLVRAMKEHFPDVKDSHLDELNVAVTCLDTHSQNGRST